MGKEITSLISMARKILDKKTFLKIKKVKDSREKEEVLRYSLKTKFISDLDKMKGHLQKLEKGKREVFFLKINMEKMELKLNYFFKTHYKKSFENILKLRKTIIDELKNA